MSTLEIAQVVGFCALRTWIGFIFLNGLVFLFSPDYLALNPVAVVEKDGVIAAFANVWAGSGKHELTVDLMRFHPDMPGGVMDYLFAEMMLWGKAQGFEWFNLGMAPPSGLEARSIAPFWIGLGAFV